MYFGQSLSNPVICGGGHDGKIYIIQLQAISEHEQVPTPPMSFSSISDVSMTFRSKFYPVQAQVLKTRYFGLFWPI